MPEGRVYVCHWEKLADGGYRGVVERPKLTVEADTLDEITQEVTEAIAEATGDCEAVIELEPPALADERRAWFSDGIVSVSPNSHFQIENTAQVVNGGFCASCGYPQGGRSNEPICVESIWPGDASFSWDSKAEGFRVLLMAERLLERFSAADRQIFAIRPATMPKGSRKKFFEVIPKHVVREVAIKSLGVSGWHCKACHHVESGHGRELGWGVHVVSRDDLPDDQMFFVGDSTNYALCMRPGVWNDMKPMLRKASISSEPLVVIDTTQVAKRVEVPEIDEVRRQNARR